MLATRDWRPVLESASARAASESAARVARVVLDEFDATQFDLAGGAAGIALALSYLSDALDDPSLLTGAQRLWPFVLERLEDSVVTPGLFQGFCGPAWVAAQLGERLGYDTSGAHDDVESVLVTHLSSGRIDRNYDLISGLVGIGAYALERFPAGESGRVLDLVVERLLDQAEQVPDGVTWSTPAELLSDWQRSQAPHGYWNLGMAHGIPGILAFLARAKRLGGLPPHGQQILEEGVRWLLRCKNGSSSRTRYASWLPIRGDSDPKDRPASRTAWCYGDLGVAAALSVAAACLEREDWMAEARSLASNSASVQFEQSRVVDHGLCHGAAGVAHLFGRLGSIIDDPALRTASRAWLERTMDMRLDGVGIDGYAAWRAKNPGAADPRDLEFEMARDDGFLMGASGVALALAAGFSNVEPSWDRALLVSF